MRDEEVERETDYTAEDRIQAGRSVCILETAPRNRSRIRDRWLGFSLMTRHPYFLHPAMVHVSIQIRQKYYCAILLCFFYSNAVELTC